MNNPHTFYVHGPTGMIASRRGTGPWNYALKDHLGSTRVVVSESGGVQSYYDYNAFGRVVRQGSGSGTRYQYTGQEKDASGLHNYRARFYDDQTGRFWATDRAGQFHSPYVYAGDPISFVDPDGKIVVPILIGAAIGATTGSIRAVGAGEAWYQGAWRGALVGGVGGALAPFGGGTFINNLAWGSGQGALTGGLDAALWGNDLAGGARTGAVFGGALAGLNSGMEAYDNARQGFGFRTNVGARESLRQNVVRSGYASAELDLYKNFLEARYSIDGNWEFLDDLYNSNQLNPAVKAVMESNAIAVQWSGQPAYIKKAYFENQKWSIHGTLYHEQMHRLYPATSRAEAEIMATTKTLRRAGRLHVNALYIRNQVAYRALYTDDVYKRVWTLVPRRF